MKFLSLYFSLLDRIAPALAAKQAYSVMSNPRVRKLRDFEETILNQAEQKTIRFRNFDIKAYQWGNPDRPLVFLVHGWEGQTGNFGGIVDVLLAKGYGVIGFDGPSHGKSTRGSTSMFEYADFITERIRAHQPRHIISHSFGSVTTIFALTCNPDIHLDQWFLVTTPNNFKDRINMMKVALGVTDRTVSHLIRLIESATSYSVDELNMEHMGSRLTNLNEATVIHSKSDKVLPITDARKAKQSIPNSTLIELDGLGHYGILWSDELKQILERKLDSVPTPK